MAAMLATRGSLDHPRPSPRSLQLGRMPKLPRELRLCVRLRRKCSISWQGVGDQRVADRRRKAWISAGRNHDKLPPTRFRPVDRRRGLRARGQARLPQFAPGGRLICADGPFLRRADEGHAPCSDDRSAEIGRTHGDRQLDRNPERSAVARRSEWMAPDDPACFQVDAADLAQRRLLARRA